MEFKEFHGYPWISMEFYRCPWISMDILGLYFNPIGPYYWLLLAPIGLSAPALDPCPWPWYLARLMFRPLVRRS